MPTARRSLFEPVRLVIADDHPLVLSALGELLSTEPEWHIVARCASGTETLEAVHRFQPDLLILDSRMPGLDSLEVVRTLGRELSATRIVLHAESGEQDRIREAVRLGVRGVALKEMPPARLLLCLHRVADGDSWLEWKAASQVLEELLQRDRGLRGASGVLTRRERDVLDLLCNGLRNRQIAAELSLSEYRPPT